MRLSFLLILALTCCDSLLYLHEGAFYMDAVRWLPASRLQPNRSLWIDLLLLGIVISAAVLAIRLYVGRKGIRVRPRSPESRRQRQLRGLYKLTLSAGALLLYRWVQSNTALRINFHDFIVWQLRFYPWHVESIRQLLSVLCLALTALLMLLVVLWVPPWERLPAEAVQVVPASPDGPQHALPAEGHLLVTPVPEHQQDPAAPKQQVIRQIGRI